MTPEGVGIGPAPLYSKGNNMNKSPSCKGGKRSAPCRRVVPSIAGRPLTNFRHAARRREHPAIFATWGTGIPLPSIWPIKSPDVSGKCVPAWGGSRISRTCQTERPLTGYPLHWPVNGLLRRSCSCDIGKHLALHQGGSKRHRADQGATEAGGILPARYQKKDRFFLAFYRG